MSLHVAFSYQVQAASFYSRRFCLVLLSMAMEKGKETKGNGKGDEEKDLLDAGILLYLSD